MYKELSAVPEEKKTKAQGKLESDRTRLKGPAASKCPESTWGRHCLSSPMCLRSLNPLIETFQLWEGVQAWGPPGHFLYLREKKRLFVYLARFVTNTLTRTNKERSSKV